MRTILFSILVAFAILMLQCNPAEIEEENLNISTDAPAYNETPGPDFSFRLMVESAMPPDGVKIFYTVKGESDNLDYPQNPGVIETTNKIILIKLINLPQQKFCVCTIKVTSKSKSSNTASKNFRVVYK